MAKSAKQVESELDALLRSDKAHDLYDGVKGARTEKKCRPILNTDLAREVSPYYRTFADRVAYTMATYAPAQKYVIQRYLDTIRDFANEGRRVLILAGGPASGKSFSTSDTELENYDVIFDTTLSNYHRAKLAVSTALKCGWEVNIQYIFRPYLLACESMLQRARETGRYVPLGRPSRLAQVHKDAQQTFLRIRMEYPAVLSAVLGNFWTPDKPVGSGLLDEKELDVGGRYRYDQMEVFYEEQDHIFERFQETQAALVTAIGEIKP